MKSHSNGLTGFPRPEVRKAKEMLILAVDDKEVNLIALERTLSDVPARIIRATSGEKALASTLQNEFALAIVDVQMPGMDGYELAEILLLDPETARIPIIFVTAAYADEGHRFRGYSSGAVDYLTKPYDPAILTAKVRVFLDLARHRQELQQTKESLARSEINYRTFFETIGDMVVVAESDGRILFVNKVFERAR